MYMKISSGSSSVLVEDLAIDLALQQLLLLQWEVQLRGELSSLCWNESDATQAAMANKAASILFLSRQLNRSYGGHVVTRVHTRTLAK